MRIFAAILALLLCLNGQSATIEFYLSDFELSPSAFRGLKMTPKTTPSVSGTNIIINTPRRQILSQYGRATFTNVVANTYTCLFEGNPGVTDSTTFEITVTNYSGTINAKDIITVSTNSISGLNAYSMASSDARYLQGVWTNGVGVGTNPVINIIVGSNQVVVATNNSSAGRTDVHISGAVLGGGAGEANTLSSLGTGWPLPTTKSGVDLRVNSITNDTSLSSSSNANTITFSRAALTGAITAAAGANATFLAADAVQTTNVANAAITKAKIENVTASKLLGRGDSGAGAPQEITIGSGLSLSGTTLSATGGGAGEANTSSNVGDGVGIANAKVSVDLPFKSFKSANALASWSTNATNITLTIDDTPQFTSVSIGDIASADLLSGDSSGFIVARVSSGLSVVGRSATGSGGSGDITAGANGQYLKRTNDTVVFGVIPDADLPSTIERKSHIAGSNYVVNTRALTVAGTSLEVASSAGALDLSADRTWTLSYDRSARPAGNPAFLGGSLSFGTNGVVFEGLTANTFEGLLMAADVTADRTWTLPDADGTMAVSASGAASLSAAGNITITRVGVYREIWIPAGAMTPAGVNGPSTNQYAGADRWIDVFSFDDTTAETNYFTVSFPDAWDRGTIKAKYYWTASTGTASQGVTWGIAGAAISDDDALTTAYGTRFTVTDAYIASGDLHVSSATSAITIGGSPALNDMVIFEVVRVQDVGDTKTGDANLIGVKLQYLESSTEPSAW